jgi:hypothetical protein
MLAMSPTPPFARRSPRGVEPRELPASERDALLKKVSPVFDYDDRAIPNWLQNWEKVFQTVQGQVKAAKITKSRKLPAPLNSTALRKPSKPSPARSSRARNSFGCTSVSLTKALKKHL